MLVRSLKPPMNSDGTLNVIYAEKISPYVHEALKTILRHIPTANTQLLHLIQREFPYVNAPLPLYSIYLKNVIIMIQYNKLLEDRLWSLIVDKLLAIDVEVKMEVIPTQEDLIKTKEDDEFGIFIPQVEQGEENAAQKEIAQKMDSLLMVVLEYIEQLDEQECDKTFSILLAEFNRLIFRTYRSKFLQFLLFYMCSIKESYTGDFLTYLFDRLKNDPSRQMREKAAMYIGTFVARFKNIPLPMVYEALRLLEQYCLGYIQECGHSSPDAVLHGPVYYAFTAIIYIILFKQEVIEPSFLEQIDFTRLTECNLNPLKLCPSYLTDEFESICTNLYPFIDIQNRINDNNYLFLPLTTSGNKNTLDIFFPFDPFFMKRSSKYFANIYTFWTAQDESDESSEDSYQNLSHDYPSEDDGGMMGVTPMSVSHDDLGWAADF
eukprot:TRINITY_DN2633_c0_g3_i1.p1 TRINITY_DN2633_c0_g3~~TRINITY_DN2633_c0_g3_i1.p1  ORF type:complete len:434 (+),score=61.52 TRINITY_DN2633_c0_g3_i1:345-1646(+)